jgi:A/G-specific adenine glycosylase
MDNAVHDRLIAWFDETGRDLPWRGGTASPWGVMVSEFMLQQTPVSRVLPVYESWMERWPTPASLALDTPGEAVRLWGRLGYPRRALRLHAAASVIDQRYGGEIPGSYEELLDLPGVGDYTAAAIASFGFGRRHVVLDTNVRRVLARLVEGIEHPPKSITADERRTATDLLPNEAGTSARWAAATMELGAIVCTSSSPECGACPVTDLCAWRAAGYPAYDGPPRVGQSYAGTDRQCRGRLLSVVRDSEEPVTKDRLDLVWSGVDQRERCLQSLLSDGLLARVGPETFALPG